MNSKWFNVNSILVKLVKLVPVEVSHSSCSNTYHPDWTIPQGFRTVIFASWHVHWKSLCLKVWSFNVTMFVGRERTCLAPSVTRHLKMLIQIEVSVDHAKGVMNFIDETAWNSESYSLQNDRNLLLSLFYLVPAQFFLVALKVREVKLHVCRIGDIAQGHGFMGWENLKGANPQSEKSPWLYPVELSLFCVGIIAAN